MSFRRARVTLLQLGFYVTCSACAVFGQQSTTNHPWSLNELIEHAQDNPRDSFATYSLLRLAEKKGIAERNRLLKVFSMRRGWGEWNSQSGDEPNWLGFTAGALALQESLQLEHDLASAGFTDERNWNVYGGWGQGTEQRQVKALKEAWSSSESVAADAVTLVYPWSLALDPDGSLAIVDRQNNRVYRWNQINQVVTGIREKRINGGDDVYQWTQDRDHGGFLFRLGPNGEMYVVDRWFGTIVGIDQNGKVSQLVSGPHLKAIEKIPRSARLTESPCEIAIGKDRSLFLAESFEQKTANGFHHFCRIRRRDFEGKIETVAVLKGPLATYAFQQIYSFEETEAEDGPGELDLQDPLPIKGAARQIGSVAIAPNGDLVFSEGRHLKRVDLQGKITPISVRGDLTAPDRWYSGTSMANAIGGDGGPVDNAVFQLPSGLAFDQYGSLFVADAEDHCVRKVTPSGQISTIAGTCIPGFSGDGGKAIDAQLRSPHGLVVDAKGNLFIADSGNGLIRRVDRSGIITTAVGKYVQPPQQERIYEPRGDRQLSNENTIKIAKLSGPTIPSLPFKEMLGNRQPEVSLLADLVPPDYYYFHFKSLKQAAEIADYATQIGRHLESQSISRGYTTELSKKIRQQLVLPPQLFEDEKISSQVHEVAVVGSDLYWELGSDFTFLIRYDTSSDFRSYMDSELHQAHNRNSDLEQASFEISGVTCQSLKSKDRSIHVYSAVLQPGVYVRSNSRPAFERIVKTVQSKNVFFPTSTLSKSLDFLYLRTLMPLNAEVEDGFVFLSDDFIRSQIGPQVRIKQSRRLTCFSTLYLLQHAGLLHQTQQGNVAISIAELVESGSLNSKISESLNCSMGGKYELDDDGCAFCSVHGKIGQMVPCADVKLEKISPQEQYTYKQFVEQYSEYWQEYFDPIGMRIQFMPESYRLETIVLPLIDNSIYTQIASLTEGAAAEFEPAPLNDETVLSAGISIDKQKTLKKFAIDDEAGLRRGLDQLLDDTLDWESYGLDFYEFLMDGIGNHIQIHVCDATPILTFNGAQDASPASFGGLLVTSLMSPVYAVIPIKDPSVVRRFLQGLEPVASRAAVTNSESGFLTMRQSFATYLFSDIPVRRYSIEVAGVGLHFHIAAINDQIIIANQPEIIQRLVQKPRKKSVDVSHAKGNVFLRISPSNWNQMLFSHRLHLESANCDACLQKIGPLTDVLRSGYATIEEVQNASQEKYGLTHVCPSGGRYEIVKTPTGPPQVICSVHGNRWHPKQPIAPLIGSNLKKLTEELEEISATLEFTPEGLRAVLKVRRNSMADE